MKKIVTWINTLNHPPNGFLSEKCDKLTSEIQENLLKTTYCTDFYINDFINESIKRDIDKNNLIIVVPVIC